MFSRPTSSGGVERLFSVLGHMCSRLRNQKSIINMETQQVYKESIRPRLALLPQPYKVKRMSNKVHKVKPPTVVVDEDCFEDGVLPEEVIPEEMDV